MQLIPLKCENKIKSCRKVCKVSTRAILSQDKNEKTFITTFSLCAYFIISTLIFFFSSRYETCDLEFLTHEWNLIYLRDIIAKTKIKWDSVHFWLLLLLGINRTLPSSLIKANMQFNRFEPREKSENISYCSVTIKSPVLVFRLFYIYSDPPKGPKHSKPAELNFNKESAGVVGHYNPFMSSDGKLPWDSSKSYLRWPGVLLSMEESKVKT